MKKVICGYCKKKIKKGSRECPYCRKKFKIFGGEKDLEILPFENIKLKHPKAFINLGGIILFIAGLFIIAGLKFYPIRNYEIESFLIFTSLLLSVFIFFSSPEKNGKNFKKKKLFAVINVVFLIFLWFFTASLMMHKCGGWNILILLLLPICIGFIIWGFIHTIKHKIFVGKIICLLDTLILVFAFFSIFSATCIQGI